MQVEDAVEPVAETFPKAALARQRVNRLFRHSLIWVVR